MNPNPTPSPYPVPLPARPPRPAAGVAVRPRPGRHDVREAHRGAKVQRRAAREERVRPRDGHPGVEPVPHHVG
eukprot:30414-Pelagococcus_subviridis.AAC.3